MNASREPNPMTPLAAWETPPCPFRIEFPPSVLEEMQRAAVDAFYLVPRGGVEIGGVLFGHIEKNCVRIETWQSIACEYAQGPSFTLSEKDQDGLAELLDQSGLVAVGWFHSHTRSEIQLSPADLEIFNRFFPGKRQIALVLRPVHLEPTRAGFFFRDEKGRIEAAASYREFAVDALTFTKMGIHKVKPLASDTTLQMPSPTHLAEPSGTAVKTWILALLGTAVASLCSFAAGYWMGASFH